MHKLVKGLRAYRNVKGGNVGNEKSKVGEMREKWGEMWGMRSRTNEIEI